MFYVISQPFLKISTWNFVHIFISHCPLTYYTFFWKFWFWGGKFWKRKNMLEMLEIFGNFQQFENPRLQFCSPTNSTSFHIRLTRLTNVVIACGRVSWWRNWRGRVLGRLFSGISDIIFDFWLLFIPEISFFAFLLGVNVIFLIDWFGGSEGRLRWRKLRLSSLRQWVRKWS